jgi:hypothetical protein
VDSKFIREQSCVRLVFQDVTKSNLVERYKCFRGKWFLSLQSGSFVKSPDAVLTSIYYILGLGSVNYLNPEEKGSRVLQSGSSLLPAHSVTA